MSSKQRRANGEGATPRQLPSGNWQWRITLGFNQGKQVTKSGTAPTRRAASQALAKAIAERDQGLLPMPNAITIREWVQRWLKEARMELAMTTQANYVHIAERHLFPLLGDLPVQTLRPSHVRDAYATLAERGYSESVIRQVRAILNRSLNMAVLEELVPRNVAAQVDLPNTKSARKGDGMSAAEMKEFLTVVSSHALGVLFRMGVITGMRRGEICGLQWKFVDLSEGILTVQNNLVMVQGRPSLGPPKTPSGFRDVMLADETVEMLKRHYLTQTERMGREPRPDDFVFSWPDGRYIHPEYATRQFARLKRQISAPHLRFHDLRHTHTDMQAHLGVPPEVVSQQLGHTRVEFTLSRYRHVKRYEAKVHAMSLSALTRSDTQQQETGQLPEVKLG